MADIKRSKKDFGFDWESEYRSFKVFKLEIADQPDVVQAMISLREENDHIELSHIERRRFRDSEVKIYSSVTPILCAFACRLSFDAGFDGFVSFVGKSKLIEYYKNQVGAIQIGSSNRMYIPEATAKKLVSLLYE